jgi:hypothetical protein
MSTSLAKTEVGQLTEKQEDPMTRRSHRFPSRLIALAALLLVLAPALASAQVVVKMNDTVSFRLGMQIQSWADWTQDPNSQGYSQNFFVRRVRFILLANVAPRVTIFYQTDNPRIGSAATTGIKNPGNGAFATDSSKFITQDAFVEWRFAGDPAAIQAGLFLVPGSRNSLTATSTFTAFDIGTWELQGNTLLQGNNGRDYGIGFNGYLLGDHLAYRMGIFDGARRAGTAQTPPLGTTAGSRNSYRFAGRWNYNFFDTEKGYTLVGSNNGAKKIVAIGGWYDTQMSYEAYGFDTIFDWPIEKNAVKFEVDYKHYDSGTAKGFATAGVKVVPAQDDFYIDAGFYIAMAKVQPFLRYETLSFSNAVDQPKNQKRFGGGLNYYIYGNNLKITAAYERIMPKTMPTTAQIKDFNHFLVQFQGIYF